MGERANAARPAAKMAALLLALTLGASAWAKIPPPPPPDEKAKAAAEAKKAKDAAAAEQAKLDQTAAENKAVKNFQSNMKKRGRPTPKPTPMAAAPSSAVPGPTAKSTQAPKDAQKKKGSERSK